MVRELHRTREAKGQTAAAEHRVLCLEDPGLTTWKSRGKRTDGPKLREPRTRRKYGLSKKNSIHCVALSAVLISQNVSW